MEVIGIGDAHLGKLDSLIPDADALITRSWRKVFKYALERGVQNVIFYGDIGERPRLSVESECAVLDTLLRPEYRELHFHFILGNHDFAENGSHCLQFLEVIAKRLDINITVYTKQTVLRLDGVRFNMLPYPYTDTLKDAVNVGHFEVSGSTRDNGRKIDHGPDGKHFTLMGHLHTPHQVRKTFFSGTLYQTNFGESMPKFFHHVTVESPKDYDVQYIPFKPPWELSNLIVSSAEDLKQVRAESHHLYKLFVKDGADIDINQVFTQYPNVVRSNSFKSKKDLTTMIEEAWEFDADIIAQDVNIIDEDEVIGGWLKNAGFKDKQIQRGFEIMKNIKGR
jgi:DNA repair exonuclease SbcCD nuclease subunit